MVDEVTEFRVSAAVGYALGMGDHLDQVIGQIIDQADANMYIDKNEESMN